MRQTVPNNDNLTLSQVTALELMFWWSPTSVVVRDPALEVSGLSPPHHIWVVTAPSSSQGVSPSSIPSKTVCDAAGFPEILPTSTTKDVWPEVVFSERSRPSTPTSYWMLNCAGFPFLLMKVFMNSAFKGTS